MLPKCLQPLTLVTRRYMKWSKAVVQSGPFKGMKYIDRAYCSSLTPKIAGTYEQELHPYLPLLLEPKPDVFIDIGAAEGYYAVGAALFGWSQEIIAYETNPDALAGVRELMSLNGVGTDRIRLNGICTPESLGKALEGRVNPAVIMDVEGFEAFLLDPLRVPGLSKCRILLEYHDFVLPGLSDEIIRRMSPTHEITRIDQAPRAGDLVCDDPVVRASPAFVRRHLLTERRPPVNHGWMWLSPHR